MPTAGHSSNSTRIGHKDLVLYTWAAWRWSTATPNTQSTPSSWSLFYTIWRFASWDWVQHWEERHEAQVHVKNTYLRSEERCRVSHQVNPQTPPSTRNAYHTQNPLDWGSRIPSVLFFPVSFVLPNRRVCGGESSNWAQEGGNSQAHQKWWGQSQIKSHARLYQ